MGLPPFKTVSKSIYTYDGVEYMVEILVEIPNGHMWPYVCLNDESHQYHYAKIAELLNLLGPYCDSGGYGGLTPVEFLDKILGGS